VDKRDLSRPKEEPGAQWYCVYDAESVVQISTGCPPDLPFVFPSPYRVQ